MYYIESAGIDYKAYRGWYEGGPLDYPVGHWTADRKEAEYDCIADAGENDIDC